MTWVLRQPLCVGKCHDRVIRETIVFRQKREIRSLIRMMRERCAIIVSTHILEEVDAVCDSVLAICSGRQVFAGSVAEFRAVSGGTLEDSFAVLTAETQETAER